MNDIPFITSDFIYTHTQYLELIENLQEAFENKEIIVPPRHHHNFPNESTGIETTMLLMPSWQDGKDAGVKVVTVNPKNDRFDLASIQGSYLYLDAITGVVKAIFDAKSLTNKRTAAASALVSKLLSNPESRTLLMVGTGALSPDLIKAHCTVRNIEKVFIWGRNMEKAERIKSLLKNESFDIEVIERLERVVPQVDIISTATMSKEPLIQGEWLKPGQHLDLVGSYKPDMREVDDRTIQVSTLYADIKEMATKESGDFKIPIDTGVISPNDIVADLFDLCQKKTQVEYNPNEISLFKSVGHAMEDLIAARYYFKEWKDVNSI